MKKKLGQFLAIAIIGLAGVLSANAQGDVSNFKVLSNVLANGQSIRQGEAIRSPGEKYILILQTDGNLCFNQIDASAPNRMRGIKCTMTVGSEDKKGAVLTMQEDGNLVLYNSKGEPLWSTDTYRGDVDEKGWRLICGDNGLLMLVNKNEGDIYDFVKGRLY